MGNVKKRMLIGPVSQEYRYDYKTNSNRDLDSISVANVVIKPQLDVLGRNKGKVVYVGENKIAGENISYFIYVGTICRITKTSGQNSHLRTKSVVLRNNVLCRKHTFSDSRNTAKTKRNTFRTNLLSDTFYSSV